MSTVYLARDETLERSVAVKVLHQEISDQPDQLERFRREARAVAQLSHPNVVAVIDAGEDGGYPYIVFEYVPGETLKARIDAAGRLPLDEAAAYAIEIGRGLAAAHAHRLIHRDVKPQNVLIDAEGRAKVTDFGIARSLESDGLTKTGPRPRHDRLRLARAGDGPRRRPAVGHLLARRPALRDAHRRASVQGGDGGRRGDEARERPDARDAGDAPGRVGGPRTRSSSGRPSKDPDRRYDDMNDMLADLEGALEVEVSRAGGSHGEATTVLESVPTERRKLLTEPPRFRGRHPPRARRDGRRAHHRRSDRRRGRSRRRRRRWRWRSRLGPGDRRSTRRIAFDPDGTGGEHDEDVGLATDGNPTGTGWSTETYDTGPAVSLSGKPGVGLILDAGSPVAARSLQVRTAKSGWTAKIYGAATGPPSGAPPGGGWAGLTGPVDVNDTTQTFQLAADAGVALLPDLDHEPGRRPRQLQRRDRRREAVQSASSGTSARARTARSPSFTRRSQRSG